MAKKPVDPPAVYKPAEVAKLLRCDARTVYGMIERGELPAIKAGRLFRIPAKAVDELLQRLAPKRE